MANDSVNDLTTLWNKEVDWVVDTIAPRCCQSSKQSPGVSLCVRGSWSEETVRALTRAVLAEDEG